jgi:putative transferase (TIGR04331 family)
LDINNKKELSELRKYSSKKKYKNFKNFISDFIIINLPKTYLEYYKETEDQINNFNLPLQPKVIFTARGVYRSTLMDRYIASKLLNNTKLLIAQHGGNYGQHKLHWGTQHEIKISNKFLSWENKKSKSIIPLGVIKKFKENNYNKKNEMILFESRNRLLYPHEFKVDQGVINSVIYFEKIKKFLSCIKEKKLLENFFVKNNLRNFGWDEKKILIEANKNIQFINPKFKTSDLMKKSKLIIYSFPSTGHLECISANIPMLMFYFNDLNLMQKETKFYFKKFINLGILHTEPQTLYKKLLEIYDETDEWWYSKKIQKIVKKYAERFCKKNDNLLDDLSRIITNK